MATEHDDVKDHLRNYLEVIDKGSFATSGALRGAANPGIFVEGIGKIGLPLSERDAKDLCRKSHEAPFGKGSETYVDSTVRKTWELNPSQFEIRNPAWKETVDNAIGHVAEQLGVIDASKGIRAELHKMLLYEEGAFSIHTGSKWISVDPISLLSVGSTEKAPGMFATLVIALPSEHTGGDVIVQLRDEKHTLSTQKKCDFGYEYLAWYADVNHSVQKITSGHSDKSQLATNLDDHKGNIIRLLERWKESPEKDNESFEPHGQLIYILNHEYSEANIRVDQLKGRDQQIARYVSQACEEQGYPFYLAHLEFMESGGVDGDEDDPYEPHGVMYHELLDEEDSSWKLQTLFLPDGQRLATDIEFEEDDIVNNLQVNGFGADCTEEFEGYTGNEGCRATHFYHKSCLVIVRRPNLFEMLSSAESADIELWVSTLLRELDEGDKEVFAREELEKLCKLVIAFKSNNREEVVAQVQGGSSKALQSVPSHHMASIMTVILRLDKPKILEDAASQCPPDTFPLAVFEELGKELAHRDIGPWHNGLKLALCQVSQVFRRIKALGMLMSEYRDSKRDSKEEVDTLEQALAQAILRSRTENLVITSADSKPLADTVVKYGEEFTSQNVIPFTKRYGSNSDFVVTFLVEISGSVETEKTHMEIAHIVCKEVVEKLIEDFRFPTHLPSSEAYPYDWPKPHRYDYGNPLPYYGSRRKYNPKTQPDDGCKFKESSMDNSGDENFLESTHLSTLFEILRRFQLHEQRDMLVNKIVGALPNAGLGVIETILLPLIGDILKQFNNSQRDISVYTRLYQSVLSAYIATYVGAQPLKPKDWKQDELTSCAIEDCKVCPSLNTFLASLSRHEGRFSINAQGRTHIEERLEAWEHAHNDWMNRRGVASKAIGQLGVGYLEQSLGEDWEAKIGLAGNTASNEGSINERKPLGEVGQGKRKRDNEDQGKRHDKHQRIIEEDESRGAVTRI